MEFYALDTELDVRSYNIAVAMTSHFPQHVYDALCEMHHQLVSATGSPTPELRRTASWLESCVRSYRSSEQLLNTCRNPEAARHAAWALLHWVAATMEERDPLVRMHEPLCGGHTALHWQEMEYHVRCTLSALQHPA